MRRIAIIILALIGCLAEAGLGNPVLPSEGRTIVMFGAHWCAPCRVELQDLPELAKAAYPDRIVLAWIDRRPSVARVAGVSTLPRTEAAELLGRVSPDNHGLPLTVILDSNGSVCAELRSRLSVSLLNELRWSCVR